MFMTRKEFNSPLNKLSADEQLWEVVVLVFPKQWIMLSIRHIQVDRNGGKGKYFKTIFLNNFSSILNKKFMASKGESIEFFSGYILLPINEEASETFDWSMEAVPKVWLAESDEDPGAIIEFCDTKTGKRYITTRFVDQNIKLKNQKRICEF